MFASAGTWKQKHSNVYAARNCPVRAGEGGRDKAPGEGVAGLSCRTKDLQRLMSSLRREAGLASDFSNVTRSQARHGLVNKPILGRSSWR